MSSPELPAGAEFQGVEQYGEAAEALFQHAAEIGFVVIRECFTPKSNPEKVYGSSGRFCEQPLSQVVPSFDQIHAGKTVIARNWKDSGYIATPLLDKEQSVSPMTRRIHAQNHHLTYGTVVQGIASFNGWQELCVSPGIALAEPDTRALSQEAIARDQEQMSAQIKKSKSPEESYHRSFALQTTLLPGDVALVMGHPRPAYMTLATNRLLPKSLWGNFRYSFK